MKVLVLGASGMLGSAMIRVLSENNNLKVFGSIRSQKVKKLFSPSISNHLVQCDDVTNYSDLVNSSPGTPSK